MEKFASPGPDKDKEKPGLSRRKFLVGALGVAGLSSSTLSMADKILRPSQEFTKDKEVERAVAETNSSIKLFDQIAEEWKPVTESILSRYPAKQDAESASFRGAKAQYKNFPEIRQALNDVLYFIYKFEESQKGFAAALLEKDKKSTLALYTEMQKYLDALQECVSMASRVPGMNDFIAEQLEGQRSA